MLIAHYFSVNNSAINTVDAQVIPLTKTTSDTSQPTLTSGSSHFGYRLVGDNIDKTVRARYIRADRSCNRSLHYFHSFALKNRIDFSHLPDVYPHTCLPSPHQLSLSLLPSKDDDKALVNSFIVHVSRILATHMPFFKVAFEDVVEWHMKHPYYDQMSQVSEVVSSCSFVVIIRKLLTHYNYTTCKTSIVSLRYLLVCWPRTRTRVMTWWRL